MDVDSCTGELSLDNDPSTVNDFEFEATVSDGTDTDTAMVIINYDDGLNHAPEFQGEEKFIQLTDDMYFFGDTFEFSYDIFSEEDEGTTPPPIGPSLPPEAVVLGTLTVTDEDSEDTLTWSMDTVDNFMIIESTGELIYIDIPTVGQKYEFMASVTDGNNEWDQAWVSADIYGNISPEFDGFIPSEQEPNDPMASGDPMQIPLYDPNYSYNDNIDNFKFTIAHNFENGIIGTLDADDENEDDVLTWSITSPYSFFEVDENTGELNYLGDAPETTQQFNFYAEVNDNTGTENATDIAYVTVKRTQNSPIAVNDSGFIHQGTGENNAALWVDYFVLEGNTLSVEAIDGLLVNDSGATPTDVLSANLDSEGEYGTVTVNADGSFDYTPHNWVYDDPEFEGITDTFTYYIQNESGSQSNIASVNVKLIGVEIVRIGQNESSVAPWVGEGVTLMPKFKGTEQAGISFEWTIEGSSVKEYKLGEHTLEDSPEWIAQNKKGLFAKEISVSENDRSQREIHFYWKESGGHKVTLNISLGGVSKSVEKTFSVKPVPDQTVNFKTNHVRIINQNVMAFGTLPPVTLGQPYLTPEAGIHIDGSQISSTHNYRLAQVLNSFKITMTGSDDVQHQALYEGPYGDGAKADLLNNDPDHFMLRNFDRPSILLRSNWREVHVEESFSTWVLFTPNESDAIPVPWKVVHWKWSGTAVSPDGLEWTLTDHSGDEDKNPLPQHDTSQYPEYNSHTDDIFTFTQAMWEEFWNEEEDDDDE